MDNSIYYCKDGRLRVYIKETKKVMSYPKYLMENKLGRKLLDNEQVHHIDQNPLNNNLSNLEIKFVGEHQKEHTTKYFDKIVVCPMCKKEFLWTAKQQRTFYGNNKRHRYKNSKHLPFCSRVCSGRYGKEIQENKLAGLVE